MRAPFSISFYFWSFSVSSALWRILECDIQFFKGKSNLSFTLALSNGDNADSSSYSNFTPPFVSATEMSFSWKMFFL